MPLSELADFVNEESWLNFKYLNISKETVESWVKDKIDNVSYHEFQSQIGNLAVVNDRAERHTRLIQDFIDQSHDENLLQDTLQVVKKNRNEIKKDMKKTDF